MFKRGDYYRKVRLAEEVFFRAKLDAATEMFPVETKLMYMFVDPPFSENIDATYVITGHYQNREGTVYIHYKKLDKLERRNGRKHTLAAQYFDGEGWLLLEGIGR